MQTIHLDIENDRFMKAMTKQQIADCAGVSVRTLLNWCKPYRQELARMGMTPGMRVLPPNIVKWMAERFCIALPT
jgi:hypothetical protein